MKNKKEKEVDEEYEICTDALLQNPTTMRGRRRTTKKCDLGPFPSGELKLSSPLSLSIPYFLSLEKEATKRNVYFYANFPV